MPPPYWWHCGYQQLLQHLELGIIQPIKLCSIWVTLIKSYSSWVTIIHPRVPMIHLKLEFDLQTHNPCLSYTEASSLHITMAMSGVLHQNLKEQNKLLDLILIELMPHTMPIQNTRLPHHNAFLGRIVRREIQCYQWKCLTSMIWSLYVEGQMIWCTFIWSTRIWKNGLAYYIAPLD